MNSNPFLSSAISGERLEFGAAGSWTAVHAAVLERLVDAAERQTPGSGPVVIDAAAVSELDTFGAWLLERLTGFGARSKDAKIVGLPDRFHGLLMELAHADRQAPPPPRRRSSIVRSLETIGRTISSSGAGIVDFMAMLGGLSIAVARTVVRPGSFRLTSTVHHLDRVGWQAVGIIFLITFLIGAIIAQQGFFHFRKFGADDYVVDLVGILVLREIGVLIVAIMVAGRSGSAYTAEFGSMKMREEIDALRTMGLDPIELLMLPRVIALVIALPILAFLGAMAALFGGGLVAWFYGGMAPQIFVERLREAISITHFEVGMIKAPFMALAIGVVACAEGLRVQGSAELLGIHTTASVVKSIFLVIILDGVFAVFFASIGM